MNAEGPAVLTDSSVTEYSGHLHVWFGGGQNSPSGANQAEQGFTLTFHGSGVAGSICIQANMHETFNYSGQPPSNVDHIDVRCS